MEILKSYCYQLNRMVHKCVMNGATHKAAGDNGFEDDFGIGFMATTPPF